MALVVGQGVWDDQSVIPYKTTIGYHDLNESQQTQVDDAITLINERKATGKFKAEEDKLQSQINKIIPSIMKQADKAGGVIDSELANQIEFRGKTLNEGIDLWNSKYTAADDMKLPNVTVLIPDEATIDVVTDSKISHVELFENMIRKEIKDEGFWGDTALSADPTGNISTLMENPDAPIEAKWALMYNLTTEFLYSGGGRKRSGDVADMFDSDTDRMNLFYNTLYSFQKLMEAETTGKTSLQDEIGADIEIPSAMEKTTGLSGLSGLLLNM